jgi:sigma-B regulation protein RsbQ
VFDYVGAGQSDLSAYNSSRYSTLDGYAMDVLEIMEALKLSDIIFVGHSVSSMIGVRAALRNPSGFSKLIFVSPSPCYINDAGYLGGMEATDLDGLFAMMDSNYLGWSASMAPLIMANSDQPELGEELASNFCATDPDIAREFARVTFLSDNRSDLQNLRVPSLTLQCAEDILAPLEVGYYMNNHTPKNTLAILKATGHCPHLSAPQETISAIDSYILN